MPAGLCWSLSEERCPDLPGQRQRRAAAAVGPTSETDQGLHTETGQNLGHYMETTSHSTMIKHITCILLTEEIIIVFA